MFFLEKFGKLYLEEVKNIYINNKLQSSIKMCYDAGDIFSFEIVNGFGIKLHMIWENFTPKPTVRVSESIDIEAEKILWKNIPGLFDPHDNC